MHSYPSLPGQLHDHAAHRVLVQVICLYEVLPACLILPQDTRQTNRYTSAPKLVRLCHLLPPLSDQMLPSLGFVEASSKPQQTVMSHHNVGNSPTETEE